MCAQWDVRSVGCALSKLRSSRQWVLRRSSPHTPRVLAHWALVLAHWAVCSKPAAWAFACAATGRHCPPPRVACARRRCAWPVGPGHTSRVTRWGSPTASQEPAAGTAFVPAPNLIPHPLPAAPPYPMSRQRRVPALPPPPPLVFLNNPSSLTGPWGGLHDRHTPPSGSVRGAAGYISGPDRPRGGGHAVTEACGSVPVRHTYPSFLLLISKRGTSARQGTWVSLRGSPALCATR